MRSFPEGEQRYVVVCRGPNCRERGGLELRKRLVQLTQGKSLIGYACFGQCDYGPNVVFYPEDVWRGALSASEAEAIVAHANNGSALPGQALAPSDEERCQHLANIADLVATVERDKAARAHGRRWWWPF